MRTKALRDPIMGYRRLAIGHHCHFDARGRMPANWSVYGAPTGKRAPANSAVMAADRALRQLCDQRFVGEGRLGGQHDTRRILVQSMNNAAPGQTCHLRRMGEEPVYQRATVMTGRGVDHQPRRFVKYDDMVVFVQQIQR